MTATLIDVLDEAARVTHQGYTFLNDELEPEEWTYADIAAEANRRACYFRSLGLKKGDRLAMIIPSAMDFVLSFFGAVRAGIIPVPMYPPFARRKIDSYIHTAHRILTTAGARMLLTDKQISPILWSLFSKVGSLEEIIYTDKVANHNGGKAFDDLGDVEISADDTCFLQFTSGSVSDPKGVVVSHGNLLANSHAIMVEKLMVGPDKDQGISWLPLYHDMGLIGFVIAPIFLKAPVVFIPTLSFVKRPSCWMETISKYKGTVTFAPNFAFGLTTKRMDQRRLDHLDLSSLRVLGCGAEAINPNTLHSFTKMFMPAGFNANALLSCYGMAEATLAISLSDVSHPPNVLTIDRSAYEEHHLAQFHRGDNGSNGLKLISCGRTFMNHEIGIIDDDGHLLENGKVGEIIFRGPSMSRGYFRNKEATRELLSDGWLHTGDLGFQLDGELYVSGRKKNLIILDGRNYYPQSIEWEVEQIKGIRKGNVVAFSTRGSDSEELVVVAEAKPKENHEDLVTLVKKRVHSVLGLRVRHVALINAGGLPKTSSGKLQHKKTKALYERGQLGHVTRTMSSRSTMVILARLYVKSLWARMMHNIKKSLAMVSSVLKMSIVGSRDKLK